MRDIVHRALDTATAQGASYADVRIVLKSTREVTVRNRAVEGLTSGESEGFGVRALVDGAWGFAASRELSLPEADRVAAEAVRIARASALAPGDRVDLGPPLRIESRYATAIIQDPFSVPLETQIGLLLRCNEAMLREPAIVLAESNVGMQRERKTFASTEGSYIEQELVETGCFIEATAASEGEVQRRSYPNSTGRHQGTQGWEFVEAYDLEANAPRIAAEASQLLTAKPCPSTVTTVILDGSQVGLQVHESCGHAIELDRVFGMEAGFAGTSFLTTEKLGTFRYGSEVVNLTADATIPGGLGTFGFDDEGVPAQRTPIVERGLFVGYLTSRETASRLGQTSNGACRADSWAHIPLIRMTNVNLEPGEWALDDLIADTDEGIYMETNRSWSIDDRRLNFQFGTEWAREIKNGKLGEVIRNATYTGMTPQFWGSCDAICSSAHWTVWGLPNCGKGQPEQVAHTGHGASPARFRNVRVGLMR